MNNNQKYKEYLDAWLNGIYGEIEFWDEYLSSQGKNCNHTKERWEMDTAYKADFMLEDDIEQPSTKFLDVGSGPLSRCGCKTQKTDLHIVAVDPLASVYKLLKERNNIKTYITPETCMVENLTDKFSENEFDIVHMSNSLDHSFDPILGLWQMLYVCKIGGKVILRHAENEAERENYQGFHQWNLSLKDGRFTIWRNDKEYDIAEMFKDYAIIELAKEEQEKKRTWIYNKIVIRKNKSTPLIKNEENYMLTTKLLESVCSFNFKSFLGKQQFNCFKILGNFFQVCFNSEKIIFNILGIKISFHKRGKNEKFFNKNK